MLVMSTVQAGTGWLFSLFKFLSFGLYRCIYFPLMSIVFGYSNDKISLELKTNTDMSASKKNSRVPGMTNPYD